MDTAKTLKGNATSSFLEQALQHAGLRPEDTVWARVYPHRIEITTDEPWPPERSSLSEKERTRRLHIVRCLQGIWSEQDEAAFMETRNKLWSQWQPRNFA